MVPFSLVDGRCTFSRLEVLYSGGGGTPLYKVCAAPKGIDFEHFGLKLGIVIGGTFTKAYKIIFLPSHRGE